MQLRGTEVFPLPSLFTPTHHHNRDIRWLHFTPFLYSVRNTLISSVKGRKNVLLFYHSMTLTSVYYYKLVNLRQSTRSSWYFSLEFQNWHFFVFFPSHSSDPCREIIGGRDHNMDCKWIQNYQIIIVFCANGVGETKQNPLMFSGIFEKSCYLRSEIQRNLHWGLSKLSSLVLYAFFILTESYYRKSRE